MKRLAFLPVLAALVASLLLIPAVASANPAIYEAPAAMVNAGKTCPTSAPCIFQETQDWWVPGNTSLTAPAASFPFISQHIHLGVAWPQGEAIPSQSRYEWDLFGQLHLYQGGHGKSVRGGAFLTWCCPSSSLPTNMVNPALDTETAVLHLSSSIVGTLSVGQHENRFTLDTISPQGKRAYQSGAWWACVGCSSGSAHSATARGWYVDTGYTNVSLKTAFRASTIQTTGLPGSLSYGIAQGATHAFAYVDPDIHGGSKGAVLFENRTGDSGSFNLPTLAPGDHVLLLGAWEKGATGWNAGVLRIPFHVN